MKRYYAFLFSSLTSLGVIQTACADEAQELFEATFSTAVILTDNESISLGIGNFSPEKLLNIDSDIPDSEASINRRNELSILSLPYTWKLNDKKHSDTMTAQLAYVKQDQNIDLAEDTASSTLDISTDKIYTFELSYNRYIELTHQWLFSYGLGAYLMHHENTFNYNSAASIAIKPYAERVYFNTQSNAFIVEPQLKTTYTDKKNWGKWQYINNVIAFTGTSFAGVQASKGARPSGWRMNNTLKFHYTVNRAKFHAESIYLKLQRSDIGGDMVSSFATRHFYEFGVGMLLDTKKFTSLADNVGIGININRGSALSGGSIVFYFNEL